MTVAKAWDEAFLDTLAVWVVLAVAVGLLWPLPYARQAIFPVLFLMVASISLTIPASGLVGVSWRSVALVTLAALVLPAAGAGVGHLVGLSPALLAGLVLLLAAPPELTTPVLTSVARGSVALSAALLLAGALVATLAMPGALALVADGSAQPVVLLQSMVLAVVLPMALGVGARSAKPRLVARGDRAWPVVSAATLVVVMALVATTARPALLGRPVDALVAVGIGGPLLLVVAALGAPALSRRPGDARAVGFTLGVRDFAVAGGLAAASGLGAAASVAPLALGVVELVVAAWVSGRWRRITMPGGGSR